MAKPMVSVVIITYGHEHFIKQAIEGIFFQQCDFEVELIIANDCSPDNTDSVIGQFTGNHPKSNWIKYTKHHSNRGMMPNLIWSLQQAKGKYIALCEGDDYWTDPLKLQKQVDFLEANEEFSICTHVVLEKNEITNKEYLFPIIETNSPKDINDYIIKNHTATCSIVFKNEYIELLPSWFSKLKFGDLGLILYVLKVSNKKMMVLKDCMGVYRINNSGVHGKLKNNKKDLEKAILMHVEFTKTIQKQLLFEAKYKLSLNKKFFNTYSTLEKLGNSLISKLKYKAFRVYFKTKIQF